MVSWWCILYAIEISVSGLGSKLFFAKLEYAGILAIPALWLTLALSIAQKDQWLHGWRASLIWLVPFVLLSLVWSNDLHHLFWRSNQLSEDGQFMVNQYGWLFWVMIGWSYLCVLVGSVLLFRAARRGGNHPFVWQYYLLLFGVSFPFIGNILSLVPGLNPYPNVDLTPYAFALALFSAFLGFYRFQLFEMVPVAHNIVLDNMQDGMIVLDLRDRIVEANKVGQHILNIGPGEGRGRHLSEFLGLWSAVSHAGGRAGSGQSAFEFEDEFGQHYYDVQVTPLLDQKKSTPRQTGDVARCDRSTATK